MAIKPVKTRIWSASILACLAVAFSAVVQGGAACPKVPKCPDALNSPVPVPPNTAIVIQLLADNLTLQQLQTFGPLLTAAIDIINANPVAIANGNTYSWSLTQSSTYQLQFDFDTTSPPAACSGDNGDGSCVGVGNNAYNSGGTELTGTRIYIYLGMNLGVCGGACFNSNLSGYTTAIQITATHELAHTLGFPDEKGKTSLMGNFSGANTLGNRITTLNPCDNALANLIRALVKNGSSCGKK